MTAPEREAQCHFPEECEMSGKFQAWWSYHARLEMMFICQAIYLPQYIVGIREQTSAMKKETTVQDQPGQHSETPSKTVTTKLGPQLVGVLASHMYHLSHPLPRICNALNSIPSMTNPDTPPHKKKKKVPW
jgi:hypothetical protein